MEVRQLSAQRRQQACRRLGLSPDASAQTIRTALRQSGEIHVPRELGLPVTAPLATIQAAVRARGADGRFERHDGATPGVETHQAFMQRTFPTLTRKSQVTANTAPAAKATGRPRADLTARQGPGQSDFTWA